MKNYSTFIYLFFLIAVNSKVQGQMVLVTNDQTILAIENLQTFDGYYQYTLYDSKVNMYIPKEEVNFIEDYSGNLSDYKNTRIFKGHKTVALKFSPSGLVGGSLISSVEKSLSLRIGLEIDMKYHNRALYEYYYEDISGWGLNVGIKYRLTNPFNLSDKNKYSHIMKGPYLKPTIGFSHREQLSYKGIEEYNITYGGFNVGYQLIFKDVLVIDIFAGAYLFTGKGTATPSHERFTIPSRITVDEGDFKGKNNFGRSIGVKIGMLIGS